MEKSKISDDILQQLEKLAHEASRWAKDFDQTSKENDPAEQAASQWIKDRLENRSLFKYQPLP